MDVQLREFLSETSAGLDAADAELVKFAAQPGTADILDKLFRLAHSIKGASGFLGLPQIEAAAHAAETQLQKFRTAGAETPEAADQLVQAFDTLRAQIAGIENQQMQENETALSSGRTLRVEADVLDRMAELACELTLARDALAELIRQFGKSEFDQPLHRLSIIAEELQDCMLKMRRRPLGLAWQSVPRLVRELAQELNKNIDLEIHGDGIEADAQIIELIKNPLIQLVRNAADHGLESLPERIAAGKDEYGKIKISAFEEQDRLIIEIADDGQGLDLAKIRQTAIRNRIVTAAECADMPGHEIQNLIFTPGFSTAADVTSISGRGIGLDIVKAQIGQLGGRVEVSSAPGKESIFTLTLPLRNVAAPVEDTAVKIEPPASLGEDHVNFLVFRAGDDRRKAVPFDLVARLQSIDVSKIKNAGGSQWAYSGEGVLPLVYVNAALAEKTAGVQPMLIFSDHARAMGLVVDEIIGISAAKLDIDFTLRAPDVIGTIIVDGSPAHIIDIGYYLPLVFDREAQTVQPEPHAAKRLVLVEDSAFFRAMLLPVLEGAGYQVKTYASARAALDAIHQGHDMPDAVVSDIDLPGMDGFEFARALKAEPRTADVPLIALSSFLSRTSAERGRAAGFKNYLAKFDRQGLIQALKKSAHTSPPP